MKAVKLGQSARQFGTINLCCKCKISWVAIEEGRRFCWNLIKESYTCDILSCKWGRERWYCWNLIEELVHVKVREGERGAGEPLPGKLRWKLTKVGPRDEKIWKLAKVDPGDEKESQLGFNFTCHRWTLQTAEALQAALTSSWLKRVEAVEKCFPSISFDSESFTFPNMLSLRIHSRHLQSWHNRGGPIRSYNYDHSLDLLFFHDCRHRHLCRWFT